MEGPLPDVSEHVVWEPGAARLPFDLGEVVRNLREERYRPDEPQRWLHRAAGAAVTRAAYYFLRPILPVGLRKHVQRLRLAGWQRIRFPRWPVDVSVDALQKRALVAAMRARGVRRLPFVWFWPEGKSACAILTHDVEAASGRRSCTELMDLDDSFGIKSAFQIVPELQGEGWAALRRALRARGFEVNIHDLRHNGYLFSNRERFQERAAQINRYAREFDSRGFRSGAMYREQAWYDQLELSYDMSVPNVAHLEPQRGGCCTVMPHFIGHVLELPLTTAQDYTLFHILGEYSTALWNRQIEIILRHHGLITLLVHPDYAMEPRARGVYRGLLQRVAQLRDAGNVWVALPAEVDRWWRSRSAMTVVRDRASRPWRIEGPDRERARVAYAIFRDARLTFEVDRMVYPQ